MMRVKNVLFASAILFYSVGTIFGQHDRWAGVVKIKTLTGGVATGFVVASKDGNSEIWTNAHVSGPVGSPINITWPTTGETTEGVTVAANYQFRRGIDAGKIIAKTPRDEPNRTIPICSDLSRVSYGGISGYPKGGWRIDKPIRELKIETPFGTAFNPRIQSGESGSPLTDRNGRCFGVATWTFGRGKRQHSGYQTIKNWTDMKTPNRPCEAIELIEGTSWPDIKTDGPEAGLAFELNEPSTD